MRMLANILLMVFTCGACSMLRISEQEHFFKPSTNDSKVYIYTLSPSDKSSSQCYLSALLLTSYTNNALSINTYLYSYDGHSEHASFAQSFTDSIQLLNESTFPINFIAADNQSAAPSYFHSFKRDKIAFEQEDQALAISSYELCFPKQKPFQVIETSTALEISGTHAIPAELRSLNGTSLNQESTLQVHTLDSIDALFKRQKTQAYYWLDFGVDGEYGSLFFRRSVIKEIEVLFNTFSSLNGLEIDVNVDENKAGRPFDNIEFKVKEGVYQVVPLKTLPGAAAPMQFWTGAVEILNMSTQKRVGVGNLFVL